MPRIEIAIEELLVDSDWAEVFADENSGNVNKTTNPIPPGSVVSTAEVTRADIAEVIATLNGENDGAEWVGVFRLKDGRYLVASGACDYTGWDCQAGNHLDVASSLDDAIRWGLTTEQRARLEIPEPALAAAQ